LLARKVEVRFRHPDGDVSRSARLVRQPLCGAPPDRPVIHCVDQGVLDLVAVVVPPPRFLRFRLELRHNYPFAFVRHNQNPLSARYRFASRSLASKAVIGRVASPRIVQASTRTRSRFVWPTPVYRSSPSTTSAPRSIGSLAKTCSTSSGVTLWRATCFVLFIPIKNQVI